MNIQEII